jgi:hypothetical protein
METGSFVLSFFDWFYFSIFLSNRCSRIWCAIVFQL